MVFANAAAFDAKPGMRDQLVAHLTKFSGTLQELGCLAYEVGVDDSRPDTVLVVELWEDAAAHRSSLSHPDVQASIEGARPLLAGAGDGFRFDSVGSPLRP